MLHTMDNVTVFFGLLLLFIFIFRYIFTSFYKFKSSASFFPILLITFAHLYRISKHKLM